MQIQKLDGKDLSEMIYLGAHQLKINSKLVDALNVFPVPDGDTGTNMNLSMTSGVAEVKKLNSTNAGEVTQAFSKGLLMGARGNSGVILSQIFRGFAKGTENKAEITAKDIAEALDTGVKTAYKAVMKPVEGTILTVAKDAAAEAVKIAAKEQDIVALLEKVLASAKSSLARTPELLPVLKEVGVVDSGGQGLVIIYEGFLASLKGEKAEEIVNEEPVDIDTLINREHHNIAQDFMNTEDIVYGYCTEFMVKFDDNKLKDYPFSESAFRNELSEHGDSLLVVSDEEVVKIHIHTEYPGEVMTIGQRYGNLINIDIENMREQHTAILEAEGNKAQAKKAPFGIVTVAMGEGIKAILESLGATVVIEGGQTMNPSTQDITEAIDQANAEKIIVLPNNSNIVMAAEQAAELAGPHVVVVPTKTVPQGISALLAHMPDADILANETTMKEAIAHVKSGQVTYAIRDTKIDEIQIEKGNFMGIAEGKITAVNPDKTEAAKQLLTQLITEDDEIITVIYGEDVSKGEAEALVESIETEYEDVEVELYEGNQPIYSYLFAVE